MCLVIVIITISLFSFFFFFFFCIISCFLFFFFFFFQAEDGIRDRDVTGVQTCALPIYTHLLCDVNELPTDPGHVYQKHPDWLGVPRKAASELYGLDPEDPRYRRSEERRVGKECRSRWSP